MRRRVRLTIALFTLAAPLLGQQPSASSQSTARLSIRSDLVTIPVIITDKSGNPVSGLNKNAFTVEENGKVRILSLFEETRAEKATTSPKDTTGSTYSNFPAHDDPNFRVTILVLDMLNTPWIRQTEAKKQLVDYLLRVATRNEPMALFSLNTTGLHQLHPFTRDTRVLLLALQKLKLSLSSEERTQPPATLTDDPTIDQQSTDELQLMSDMLQDLNDTISANYQRMATRETLYAMTQIARALQAVPGRKTLIWATAGFPFVIDDPNSFGRQGDDLGPEYQDAWRSLDSANIAVYPVDLGSVDFTAKSLPSANSTVSRSQTNTIRGTNGLRSPLNLPYDQGVQQRLTMHAFADATGGRACITISEFEKCFAQAIDDSHSYYLLGYYLGDDTQPGWRKLKVKVAGEGLHVRYRTGFYVAAKLPDTGEQRRKEIIDALASPVQYTGLRLTVRLLPSANKSASPTSAEQSSPSSVSTKSAEFILGLMGDSITVDHEKGNAVDLQITTLAFDSNHKSVASSSKALSTSFNPDMLQKILQTGIGIPEKVELAPGKYEIKFAVRDNLTGIIGTISTPLQLE
jgi:VWFA-related protein